MSILYMLNQRYETILEEFILQVSGASPNQLQIPESSVRAAFL